MLEELGDRVLESQLHRATLILRDDGARMTATSASGKPVAGRAGELQSRDFKPLTSRERRNFDQNGLVGGWHSFSRKGVYG